MSNQQIADEELRKYIEYILGFGDTFEHGTLQTCSVTVDNIDEIMLAIQSYIDANYVAREKYGVLPKVKPIEKLYGDFAKSNDDQTRKQLYALDTQRKSKEKG